MWGLSLLLLLWVYLVPFPHRLRTLTASMPVLLGLQFLTIHLKSPLPLAVLHPLIRFTLFSVSATLVHHVQRLVFSKPDGENDASWLSNDLKMTKNRTSLQQPKILKLEQHSSYAASSDRWGRYQNLTCQHSGSVSVKLSVRQYFEIADRLIAVPSTNFLG